MERMILIGMFIFLGTAMAVGDVLRLEDGTIYLGELKSTGTDGVVFSSFGETRTINQSEVIRMDKDISSLSKKSIEIELKDGSMLHGELCDFDEEIGVLVKTDFGNITFPTKGIKTIFDGEQKRMYGGYPFLAGLSSGYYAPQGEFKSNFSSRPFFSLFAEVNSLLVRGLYIGGDFSYLMMKHESSQLDYNSYQFKAYASYRYLGFRNVSAFYRMFVPFASLGMGLTYITMKDDRTSSSVSRQNQMDPVYSIGVGLDTDVYGPFVVRVQGGWFAIHEESKLLHAFTGTLGVVYRFK